MMRNTGKKVFALVLVAFFVTCILCGLSWVKSSQAQTPSGINVAMGDGSVRFLPNHLIGFVVGQELRIRLVINSIRKLRRAIFQSQRR